MFESLNNLHVGMWTFYLFLWAIMAASLIGNWFESRQADYLDNLRQICFTHRDMIGYQQYVEHAYYHRKLAWRWDYAFYIAGFLNLATGHLLGIFPWQ